MISHFFKALGFGVVTLSYFWTQVGTSLAHTSEQIDGLIFDVMYLSPSIPTPNLNRLTNNHARAEHLLSI